MPELSLFIGMSPLDGAAGAQADNIKARLIIVKRNIFLIMVPL